MTNLSERVMSLSGPDRKVDWQIAESLGWTCRQVGQVMAYYAPNDAIMKAGPPKWTASIDAAMTLVPEGYKHWNLGGSPTRGFAGAGLYGAVIDDQFYGEAQTPALALCAAALIAREASNGDL